MVKMLNRRRPAAAYWPTARCLSGLVAADCSTSPLLPHVQMQAAREYFVEQAASGAPHASTNLVAQRSAAPGSSGGGGSGLLQAALQAQAQEGEALHVAAAATALPRTALMGRARGNELLAHGSGASGARGNLLWRLESSGAGGAGLEQEPCQMLPIGSASSLPIPFNGLPASHRDSFDSYESDPGSPASGSLWYWGSPAELAGGGGPRLRSAALRGTGSTRRSGRGSSDSHDSWEDVSAGGGGSNGATPAAVHAVATSGPRLSFQQQQQERRAAVMHVGSAPSPSILCSPPSHGPLAWAGASRGAGRAGGGRGLHRVASDGQLLAKAGGGMAQQQPEGAAEQPEERGWPAPHAFTAVSRVYTYRTVVLHWADPRLPDMLRPVIQVATGPGPRRLRAEFACLHAQRAPPRPPHPTSPPRP